MANASVRKCLTTGGAVAASSIVTLGLVVVTPEADDPRSEVGAIRLAAAVCPTVTPRLAVVQRWTSSLPELTVPISQIASLDSGIAYRAESTADTTPSRSVANGTVAATALPPVVEAVVGRIAAVGLVAFFVLAIPVAAILNVVYRVVDAVRGLLPIPLAASAMATADAVRAVEPEPVAPSLKSEPPANEPLATGTTTAQPSTSDGEAEDEAEASESEEPKVRPATPRPIVRAALAFGERLRGLVRRGAEADDVPTSTEPADDEAPQAGNPPSVASSTDDEPSGGDSTDSAGDDGSE